MNTNFVDENYIYNLEAFQENRTLYSSSQFTSKQIAREKLKLHCFTILH